MAFGHTLSKKTNRVALFIDGSNLYATVKGLRLNIDYKRLLKHFNDRYDVVRAYYYTAIENRDEGESDLRPMVDWLEYNGYTLRTKPIKKFIDETTGKEKIKGNVDMEMAVDIVKMCTTVQDIFILTGDGDFRAIVEYAQDQGCRVHIVSTLQTKPPMVADELRRQADSFIDIHDIREQLERRSNE